jgi:endoglucanase
MKVLSELPGAPGREEHVRSYIAGVVEPHCDEMRTDVMGNLICRKRSANPDAQRVMIACHMDEIAFYVRQIDANGFLRVQALGGFDTRNLFARRVRIETRSGRVIYGNMNPAGAPVHIATPEERKKVPEIKDFFVDTGLSKEDLGDVRPGDPWLGVRILEQLEDPTYDTYVVFTTQEEIGIRGAITSSYDVDPDIGIAIDVTLAVDTPGVADDQQITRLGDGTAIKILDSYAVSDKNLVDEFITIAEENEIRHQFELLPMGGTDAAALQRARGGCRAICISVPTRYVHTVTETLHKDDLFASLDLLLGFLRK